MLYAKQQRHTFFILFAMGQATEKCKINPIELWISYFNWSKNYVWASSNLVVLNATVKCAFLPGILRDVDRSGPGSHFE